MSRYFLFLPFIIAVCCGISYCDELPQKQRTLAERYVHLEQVLLRLAETSATSNPKNVVLLKKVLLESKDKLLAVRLEKIVRVLEDKQLNAAVNEQENAEKDLAELLKLLESENRGQRRDGEKEKIKKLLRDIEELTQRERALKNKTASQPDPLPKSETEKLSREQEQIQTQTQTLKDQLAQNNAESDEQKAAAEAVEKASKKMEQAKEKLQKAEKSQAVEEQEDALAELLKAKAELEKKLKALREEELIQVLEKLEERFKRMLQTELAIRSQTEKLGKAAVELARETKIQADRLTGDQQSVINDADAAALILKEDGTARAMVETLEQARFDMLIVVERLRQPVFDSMTLQVEDSVIVSLKEMIDAVQAAKEEAKQRADGKQPPMSGEEMQAGEEPLIQLLSELRMIRTMQRRVNERTASCETEIAKRKAEQNADLLPLKKQVEELAKQQSRISRILHDLKIGKTK